MTTATPSDNGDAAPAISYPPGLPDEVAPLGGRIAGALRTTLVVFGLAGIALIVGALTESTRRQFFHSYLFGYAAALEISLGALFWVLIHHVSDAGWSVGLRRIYENMTRALVPLALLFIPVLVGIYTGNLHQWYDFITGPEPAAGTHEHHQWHVKHLYFAPVFFLVRLALYFGVWIAYATAMQRWSDRQDAVGGAELTRKMQWWAPSGVVLLGVTSTFFAFDVLMSLQFSWFSTIFGVLFWTGGIRSSLSAAVLLVLAMRVAGYLRHTITMEHLHDAAKLMFAFTIFWAYIAFAQYFLIWYGNVPEETQYYLLRRNGAWYTASILLPILYFGVPFFLLLPRANKRNPAMLAISAAWILAMHSYDLYWQVLPVLHTDTIHFHWLDVAAPVFMGSVVVLAVLWGWQRLPLIPVRDARLNATIGYENETP
jgi:hypothetical protein